MGGGYLCTYRGLTRAIGRFERYRQVGSTEGTDEVTMLDCGERKGVEACTILLAIGVTLRVGMEDRTWRKSPSEGI